MREEIGGPQAMPLPAFAQEDATALDWPNANTQEPR